MIDWTDDVAAPLIAALIQFADKRGHWPGCRQSRRVACFTTYEGRDEVPSPCSPRCVKARKAIEAVGGAVEQKIGYRPGPSNSIESSATSVPRTDRRTATPPAEMVARREPA